MIIRKLSAIDATTNAIDRSSHVTWPAEILNYSISSGSLCHDLILQAFYRLVKGVFASIVGTYTHFRDFGDQYVMKFWHFWNLGSGVESNVRVCWYLWLGLLMGLDGGCDRLEYVCVWTGDQAQKPGFFRKILRRSPQIRWKTRFL